MGVGMVVICAPDDADVIVTTIRAGGVEAWVMGDVGNGTGQVLL
jgi:phosphoribosylaminoimidazole (AIR) synthetase